MSHLPRKRKQRCSQKPAAREVIPRGLGEIEMGVIHRASLVEIYTRSVHAYKFRTSLWQLNVYDGIAF